MENEQEMIEVCFRPQAWQNDNAISVDPEGPCLFSVPRQDTIGMRDDSDESDGLKEHCNAPEWIKNWQGPFYFEIDRFNSHQKAQV